MGATAAKDCAGGLGTPPPPWSGEEAEAMEPLAGLGVRDPGLSCRECVCALACWYVCEYVCVCFCVHMCEWV